MSLRFRDQLRTRTRREGIALLVVMVVFVVLYLVVFQLHFTTKMEEHIAQMRYGELENAVAAQSAAIFILSHLAEDLTQDASGASAEEPSRSSA
ncbi:MAG: hypothetical protein HY721_30870, partial [Planctomycetes bacterium]|nr:hypothetical protein [Planctomycetota bacterium]